MQLTFGLTTLVLLALLAKGQSQLQCYVCDNCAKIDKTTPIEMCGPDVAATTTTIMPSGVPTGMTTETSTSAEPSSTTTTSTTTTTTTPSTTTIEITTPVTGPPTPPTVGPIAPTTELPTPPEVELPLDFELPLNNTHAFNSTSNFTLTTPTLTSPTTTTTTTTEEPITTFPSTTQFVPLSVFNATTSLPLLRQRRYIPENAVTYHCYKVLKKYDNVYGTQRGCMAVQTQQSVCGELKAANQNQIQKCRPCTKSMCNGSSTIGVSIAGLLVALVAVIYRV